jgi:ATP phosphoribosyltransferase regulatory subunit
MINNLPNGIRALSGVDALKLENSRRDLIDNFVKKDYQLVLPPPISFASHNPSFKFSDSSSNKTLEIVADITREVAIIDGKNIESVNKYCYCNQIVKPFSDDFYSSRNPTQVGCEIYGDNSNNADVEVIENLVASLDLLGVKNINITLSNLEIIASVIGFLGLDKFSKELTKIITSKSSPDLLDFISQNNIDSKNQLLDLISGDFEKVLKSCDEESVKNAINKVVNLKNQLDDKNLNAEFIIDLSDNSSYNYHNGLIFSAYGNGFSKAIARGGRYDCGKYNGSNTPRNATGFSFDLNFILFK